MPQKKITSPNKTVVEICCGLGGTRVALEAAGFKVSQSIDFDKAACDFHNHFWGDADCADITNIPPSSILDADLLSAGFPCQPFSSSGYRTGFSHEHGNVFSSLLNLIDHKNYQAVFLENVIGLLNNEKGQTFKIILSELAERYKKVEWITINLTDLGIPQNRPRVVIIAHNNESPILGDLIGKFFHTEQYNLFSTELSSDLRNQNFITGTNHPFGLISERKNLNLRGVKKDIKHCWDLMSFLFQESIGNFKIYSGRFWGRTGKTTFYISQNQYSHSVGTSMGAAPTFGIDPKFASDEIKSNIATISNWNAVHSGFYVFRLKPSETLKLFGEMATIFADKMETIKAPLNNKYKLIGNMFAPNQALIPLQELIKIIK